MRKLPSFPIHLTVEPQTLINTGIGAYKEYVCRANGLEIARFIDPESSYEYLRFLKESNFKSFKVTKQGRAFMEIIYQMYENQKPTPEIKEGKNGKEIIIRSLDQ